MIPKKTVWYILAVVILGAVGFALGLFASGFHAVCGNGCKEYGETLETCPQDFSKIDPFESDAVRCMDNKWKTYPSTGKDAAQWFFYGCGKEKFYRVNPNEKILLVLTCGDNNGWRDNKQALTIWEKKDGKWWQMQNLIVRKELPRKIIIHYVPKSDVIKIKAEEYFFLEVYTEKPIISRIEKQAKEEPKPVSIDTVDYVSKEFNYKIKVFKDMRVENPSADTTSFFHSVYGRNPFDAQQSVPAVTVRVIKCWGREFADCVGEGLPQFSNCSKSKFSWPPSKRKVGNYVTFQVERQCNEEEYRALAVIKDDSIYLVMFLLGSEKYVPLPLETGSMILDSFDFTEVTNETAK